MTVVHFKMAARRVNMHYLMRETVELVLNEGLDLEDFFGRWFSRQTRETAMITSSFSSWGSVQPVDFIFLFLLCLDSSCFAFATEKGIWYDYGLFIWQVHIPSFLKMYLFIVLFLVVYLLQLFLNGQKQCVYRSQAHHFVASWMS